MSDLSIIAHDYELNAEFARKFNEAVLNLKRLYLLRRAAKPETRLCRLLGIPVYGIFADYRRAW